MASDEELFAKIKRGDRQAFQSLYHRYETPLFRYIYGIVNQREIAEEIFHETFIIVFNQKDVLKLKTSFKSWIYTVARHRALNHKRATRHGILRETDWAYHGESESENPELTFLRSHQQNVIAETFENLEKEDKHMVQMRSNGMSHRDIAKVLAIPIGTVKSRFFHIIKHLRKEISKWDAS